MGRVRARMTASRDSTVRVEGAQITEKLDSHASIRMNADVWGCVSSITQGAIWALV